MWVSRTAKARVLLLLAVLGTVQGCEDTDVAAPSAPVEVILTPPGPFELGVGDTVRVRAVVGNASAQNVVFSSSAPEIAAVDAGGLITGRSPGGATISAHSALDPRAGAAVFVRVDPPKTPPPTSASVVIEAVVDSLGRSVDPGAAAGELVVRLVVDRTGADRVEVLLNGAVACSRSLAAAGGAGSSVVLCPVNTAAFDSATGAVVHPNAATTVSARLLDGAGGVLEAASGPQLLLANPDRVLTRVSPERAAADSAGRTWYGGELRVSALPVIYSPGTSVRRVAGVFHLPGEEIASSDETAPYDLVFPAAALAGRVAAEGRLVVSTVLSTGQPGPAAELTPLRYDAAAPAAGTLREREWLGATTTFASLYEPPAADVGVGGVTTRYFAGPSSASTAQLLAGREVQRGADLTTSAAREYRVVAQVCDALENCRVIEGFRFGVDLSAPTIASTGLADRVVNPTGDLAVAIQDEGSGFGALPLLASVEARVPGLAQSCGPVIDGVDLPGRLVGGLCQPDTVATVLPIPRSTSGYYVYTVQAVDRAGNRSEQVRRTVLVDATPPTITTFTVPAQLTPGAETTFTAEVRDNLDLNDLTFAIGFPGAAGTARSFLPFSAPVQIGTPFEGTPVIARGASAAVPFVRSLTYGSGAATSRVTVLSDSAYARVTDAAGLTALAARPLPSGGIATVTDPLPLVASTAAQLTNTTVCTQNCLAGDPTSTSISFRISGTLDLVQPFDRVYFYRVGQGGQARLLGSTTSFRRDDVVNVRTYTYTFAYTPAPGLEGNHTVFAVGLVGGTARAGAAIRSEDVGLTLIRR